MVEEKMFGHEHVEKMMFTGPRQGDPGAAVCGTRDDGTFWCSGEGSAWEMEHHAKMEALTHTHTAEQTPQMTVGDLSRIGTTEPMKNTPTSYTCPHMTVGDLSRPRN